MYLYHPIVQTFVGFLTQRKQQSYTKSADILHFQIARVDAP